MWRVTEGTKSYHHTIAAEDPRELFHFLECSVVNACIGTMPSTSSSITCRFGKSWCPSSLAPSAVGSVQRHAVKSQHDACLCGFDKRLSLLRCHWEEKEKGKGTEVLTSRSIALSIFALLQTTMSSWSITVLRYLGMLKTGWNAIGIYFSLGIFTTVQAEDLYILSASYAILRIYYNFR